MSTDEDTELRDLVASTLETNGVLNKIRAELRANVFLALEEHDALEGSKAKNIKLENFLDTKEGHMVFSLIRECLEYYNLDFTLAVFDPETNFSGKFLKRDAMKRDLEIHNDSRSGPLLHEVLRMAKTSKENSSIKENEEARGRFNGSKVTTSRGNNLDKNSDSLDDDPLGLSNKSPPAFQRVRNFPRGSLDGDDDIFAEFEIGEQKKKGIGSKRIDSDDKTNDEGRKDKGHSGNKLSSSLGTLKDAPPLPGLGKDSKSSDSRLADDKSPDWNDLAAIEEKINRLGFEIPKDDFDYEEDFQPSSSKKSEGELSITEEIEEDLSIGSFADSKVEDGLTTDQTVSRISGTGLDYGEDIEL